VLFRSDDLIEDIAAAASGPALGDAVLPRSVDRALHARPVHGSNGSENFQPVLLVVIQEAESGSGLISFKLTILFRLTIPH
jgi:hypothetical protein